MPLTIDHDSFPNIIDTIIRLGPHDTLVVLRDTCRDIKSKIGILLPRHLQLVIRDDLPPDDPECLRWRVWGTRIDVGEGRTLSNNASVLHVHNRWFPSQVNDEIFSDTKLIRILPIPERHPEYKEKRRVWINVSFPNSTAVAFLECHGSVPRGTVIFDKVRALVMSLLCHPEEVVGLCGSQCFIPVFPGLDLAQEIYFLLIPEGWEWKGCDGCWHCDNGIRNARNPSNLTVLAWGLVEEFPDRPIRFVGAEEWDDNWLRRKVPRQYFESELDTIDFALRLVNDSALDVGADYLNIEEDCGPDATVADRFKWWINAMADVYHSTDERMRMRIRQNVAFMTMDEFKAKQHGDEMAALMTSQYRSRG